MSLKAGSPQVLVVGAGPTGLATAAALARRGVRVRIIDKNSARSDKSKALGVHAGTLECLAAEFGEALSDKISSAGNPARQAHIHVYDKAPAVVDLSVIQSRHNYVLILGQSETERILEENLNGLGVTVERSSELVSLTQDESKVLAQVRRSDGATETIQSYFIVGCDGAHSVVRHLLEIPFRGDAYSGNFALADLELDWPWDYGSVRVFISGKGFLAGFPLDGKHKYRIVLAHNQNENRDLPLTNEGFGKLADMLTPQPVRFRDFTWLTRFRVHHRITRRFIKGRAVLAGDAAHIHSPAGGQGMNIGIQDGLSLAYYLEKIILHGASFRLLEKYEKERYKVARAVVRGTDTVTRLGLIPEGPIIRFFKLRVFPLVLKIRFLQAIAVRTISEVAMARKAIRARSKNP